MEVDRQTDSFEYEYVYTITHSRAMTRTLQSVTETAVNQQLVTAVNPILYCVRTPVTQVLQPGHYL